MPIIVEKLIQRQMGFRKGKGTRGAIFQLRMISVRVQRMVPNILVGKKERKQRNKIKRKRRKITFGNPEAQILLSRLFVYAVQCRNYTRGREGEEEGGGVVRH